VEGILVDSGIPATFTTACVAAINDMLHTKIRAGPLSLFKENICPVSKRRGGALSPTAATAPAAPCGKKV
jgi:hypothetical protein